MTLIDYEMIAAKLDSEAASTWPAPQPLTSKIEAEPYPVDALPMPIQAAVKEVTGFVKSPIAMVASSALAALSLAAQAHIDAKRADKLQGPVGLFLLTIADSGERKSTCDGFFTKAIREYEREQADLAKPFISDYRANLEIWDAKRNGIKDKIRQTAKESKPTVDLESALRDLEYTKPVPPRVPRLMHTDITPEQLGFGLANQWPSGGVLSSEAGIVFGSHGMGKDSVMRNLALLNILWDGGETSSERRSVESFTVRGARFTMALQVQEATLREFLLKSGALARGTGFLARFFTSWPESTQGMRPYTEPPSEWLHLDAFNKRIAEILAKPVPIDKDGALTPLLMPLSPAAKKAWIAYHDAIEVELSSIGEYSDIKDVASKSADNAVRLAALFEIFEGSNSEISEESFNSASLIAAWHLEESRRFFGELALPQELIDAGRLEDWLIKRCRSKGLVSISYRDAQRFGAVRDKDKLPLALEELQRLDRIRVDSEGKGKVIYINPAVLKI